MSRQQEAMRRRITHSRPIALPDLVIPYQDDAGVTDRHDAQSWPWCPHADIAYSYDSMRALLN